MSKRMIGNVSVNLAIEMAIDEGFPPEVLVPDLKPEVLEANHDLLVPFCVNTTSGGLKLSIHTWLVRTAHHTILVDTCNGNDKDRPGFPLSHKLELPYLERLAALGVRPEDVDIVLCTHLHVDHCGWNTRLQDGRWVPTFPKARYIFSRQEYDQWNPLDTRYPKNPVNDGVFNDSVLPIVEAGLAQMIEGDHAIDDQMLIEPAPGHTYGQVMLKVTSQGSRGVFCGDALHHPVQVLRPEWNSGFCDIADLARKTRRQILEYCTEHNALLMPAHFPPPHAVRVRAAGERFTFTPE